MHQVQQTLKSRRQNCQESYRAHQRKVLITPSLNSVKDLKHLTVPKETLWQETDFLIANIKVDKGNQGSVRKSGEENSREVKIDNWGVSVFLRVKNRRDIDKGWGEWGFVEDYEVVSRDSSGLCEFKWAISIK